VSSQGKKKKKKITACISGRTFSCFPIPIISLFFFFALAAPSFGFFSPSCKGCHRGKTFQKENRRYPHPPLPFFSHRRISRLSFAWRSFFSFFFILIFFSCSRFGRVLQLCLSFFLSTLSSDVLLRTPCSGVRRMAQSNEEINIHAEAFVHTAE
jgi:hypothetical protein